MIDFINFIQSHMFLSGVFVALLFAVIALEFAVSQSNQDIGASKAVDIINHENALVIDVRLKAEFDNGHIVNAVNYDVKDIASAAKKLAKYKTKPIVLVCSANTKSKAIKELKSIGLDKIYVLQNGISAWQTANLPLVK